MLLLWLVTFALAALPQLHSLLHKDAQTLNHNCLITQLQQHSLLSLATVAVAPAPPPLDLSLSHSCNFEFLPTGEHRLAPSRAPPTFSSSAPVVG